MMVKLRDIVKTTAIIKVSPEDTLSSALAKLSSSHDAAFVFNEDKKYLGVVNPYYCLIRSKHPGSTKVQHALFHPPHIKLNSPVNDVARLFNESKIHYLPVFDEKDTFIGIVTARRLLAGCADARIYDTSIGDYMAMDGKKLAMITPDDSIAHAIQLFRDKKVSKLIVMDESNKLHGIISHYDLIPYLIAPKDKPQRGERKGKVTSVEAMKVRNFVKSQTILLKVHNRLSDAINQILKRKIGSVIVINEQGQPINIITTSDLLTMLMQSHGATKAPVEIVERNLSPTHKILFEKYVADHLLHVIEKRDIREGRIFIKEEKNGKLFKITVNITPNKGQSYTVDEEGNELIEVLKEVKKELS